MEENLQKKAEPARSEGESFWGPIELVLKPYSVVDASSTDFFII